MLLLWTNKQIEAEKQRAAEQRQLTHAEKQSVEGELKVARPEQDNLMALQDSAQDVKSLGKRLPGKIRNLGLQQKQILLIY